MLTGSFCYVVDQKGRVILPAPFRATLGESLIFARAPEGCVLALSRETWAQVTGGRGAGQCGEYWLSGAHECLVDPVTGRVLIPWELRTHLGLRPGDEVIVAGVGDGALLCRRERFSARLHQLERRILAAIVGAVPELAPAGGVGDLCLRP